VNLFIMFVLVFIVIKLKAPPLSEAGQVDISICYCY
jgi:hypothetical protein